MSYKGDVVIDMDSHIREYVDLDRTYKEHIDPAYREKYERLSAAVASRQQRPGEQVLFMRPDAVVGPVPARRPLGVYDTFERLQGSVPHPPIDPACNWDPAIRLRDMDTAGIDISVIFASQSDGFCVLRDIGFEHALNQAYHRFMSSYCAESGGRLRWVANSTMRDIQATVQELTHWAEQDENFAGNVIPRMCPDGRLLDNPDLHPLFERSQDLDLPLWVHGGTMRPPLTPGATDLDNAGFLIGAVYHGWGGQTALGTLIGSGLLDLFPQLRVGVFESGAGWMPWLIERLDDNYRPASGMTPYLNRTPSEVIAEGRLFCSVNPGERSLEYCVETLGEDIWLFSTDYPHVGTPWPDGIPLIAELPGLSEGAKIKMFRENAKKFLPRLAV